MCLLSSEVCAKQKVEQTSAAIPVTAHTRTTITALLFYLPYSPGRPLLHRCSVYHTHPDGHYSTAVPSTILTRTTVTPQPFRLPYSPGRPLLPRCSVYHTHPSGRYSTAVPSAVLTRMAVTPGIFRTVMMTWRSGSVSQGHGSDDGSRRRNTSRSVRRPLHDGDGISVFIHERKVARFTTMRIICTLLGLRISVTPWKTHTDSSSFIIRAAGRLTFFNRD